nr:hypothetical protein BaRGS_027032 [Batillaria attramentaria]
MEAFGTRTALTDRHKDTETENKFQIDPNKQELTFAEVLHSAGDVTLPPPAADPAKAIASLLFSSGTTGIPKGVQITQRNIMACIHVLGAHDNELLQETDTVCSFVPFFHVYGQVFMLLVGLAYGCRHVIMSKFEMVPFLNICQRYRVTVLSLVPPVVVGMANFPGLADYDLSSVRVVFSGAAPLGKEVEAQFIKKLNVPCILQGYGMTENMATAFCTFKHTKPASVGRILPNTEIKARKLRHLRCRPCNHPHRDMARIDADGYLYIVDRLKELIKYKGEQVAPAVLEDLLMAHPELSDVCVIGVPDTVAGELPRAYVVRIPGSKVTEQEVKDFVAKQVPSYMQLRGGVEFRENIPKSPSGKILRRLLRDELKQQQKSRL